jgi:hypothetical protein
VDRITAVAVNSLEVKRVETEIKLAMGDKAGALLLCGEILEEAPENHQLLNDLLPLLIELDAAPQISQVITQLTNARLLDKEVLDRTLSYLKETSHMPMKRDLAERLLDEGISEIKYDLISLLARIYLREEEVSQLVELGKGLIESLHSGEEKQDYEALYQALGAVGQGLKELENPVQALEVFEHQLFMQPDRGGTLKVLGEIAEHLGLIRKATAYRELYHLLHPQDHPNNLKLANQWFFQTHEYDKAYALVNRVQRIFREDPKLVVRIVMGYFILKGDLQKAIAEVNRYRYSEEIKSPLIMYHTACLYYVLGDSAAARRVFNLLEEEFEDHQYAPRCQYLKKRLSSPRDRRKGEPEYAPEEKGLQNPSAETSENAPVEVEALPPTPEEPKEKDA